MNKFFGLSPRKQNLLISLISSVLFILVLEIALQIAAPPPRTDSVGWATLDTPSADIYGWALPPNSELAIQHPDTLQDIRYTTNSRGWKDVEHNLEKSEGLIRILVVGDSYTFSVTPIEEQYSRQIERLLHEQGHTQVEVISIGVGGWGTDQILEVLRSEGLLYEPDFVIYQATQNDLVENLYPIGERPGDGNWYEVSMIYWYKRFRYEISDPDQGLQRIELTPPGPNTTMTIKDYLLKSALIYNLNEVKNRLLYGSGDQTNTLAVKYNPTSPYFHYTATDLMPETKYAWDLMGALVLAMQATTAENSAELLIFSPNGDETLRDWELSWGRIETDEEGDFISWDGLRYEVNMWRFNSEMETIATAHNIPLITPTRGYERFQNDSHPNASGNLAMAHDVVDFLSTWEPFIEAVNTSE